MSLKVEKMRYQKNSISYWLALLSIVFNSLYMVDVLENMTILADVFIGIDIIINILFMMFVFLGSEKAKVYSKTWGYILIFIGILSILRISFIPYRLHFIVGSAKGISFNNFIYLCIMLILAGVCLIVSGVITINKSTKLHNYLKTIKE
jgi:Na+(H+)/acetate symporter ActP